jgi:hypothetical protein
MPTMYPTPLPEAVTRTGIDHLLPEDEDARLYVGLSRARVHLAIVANAATIERLGLAPCHPPA